MSRYSYVFFDLDGTIIETQPWLVVVGNKVLEELGLPGVPYEAYRPCLGPSFAYSLENYLNVPKDKIKKGCEIFEKYCDEMDLGRAKLYDGILELFGKLRAAGIKTAVLTAKPAHLTDWYMKNFGIEKYMDGVYAVEGHFDHDKSVMLKDAIKKEGIDPKEVILVGDRRYDIEAAKKAGVKSIGVLYGYGSREEFKEYGADYIAEDMKHLESLLLGGLIA